MKPAGLSIAVVRAGVVSAAGALYLSRDLPLLVAVALLLAGMMLATHAGQRFSTQRALVLLLLVGAAARLPVLLDDPKSSDDLYRYLWEGRIIAAGENPYVYPPDSPRFAHLRDESVHARVNNQTIPTIYPPVAQVLFLGGHLLGGTPAAWKVLLLLIEVLAAWGLGRFRLAAGRDLAPVALFLWNPLLIAESAEGGHVDAAGAALLLGALVFSLAAPRRDSFRGTLLLLASLAVKPAALALIPFQLRGRRSVAALLLGIVVFGGSLWFISFVPEGGLEPPGEEAGLWGAAGWSALPARWSWEPLPQGRIRFPADVWGEARSGITAPDGRAAIVEPTATAAAALAVMKREQVRVITMPDATAPDLLGRYALAILPTPSAAVHLLDFDGRENVALAVLDDAAPEPEADLGYYCEHGGFTIYDRSSGAHLAHLQRSAERAVLQGELTSWPGLGSGPAFALKIADLPTTGTRQFSGRWSGPALLHPLFESLTGSRQGAAIATAILLALLCAVLLLKRASLPVAGLVLTGAAVAALPVIYAWYLLWLLPGAVLLRGPRAGMAAAILLGAGMLLRVL